MNHKLSERRRSAGVLTLILAVAIVVTGTLAWQAISQRAVNNVAGKLLPAGARLHDDFGLEDEPDFTQPLNKDVYVENYSGQNPLNTSDTGETVFVRVKLTEYMETGVGAGLFTVSGNDPSDYQTPDQVDADGKRIEDPANDAASLVAGASILNINTWRTHIEDDATNPFAAYWNWTLGGTKAFMPTFNKDNTNLLTDRTEYAQDEFAAGVDAENGTARYSNPAYDNNPEEHTAKDTLATAGIVSMTEWMNDLNHPLEDTNGNGYWVGDSDGWYYWSKGLEAGEATALLLDQITLTGTIEGEFYYGIHVISQMATAGDWGDETAGTGFYEESLTADGRFLLDQAAGSSTEGRKLLYAPMDDIGAAIPDTMLLYAPMDGVGTTSAVISPNLTDSVTNTIFSINTGGVTNSTNSKVGTNSAYFSGVKGQRITNKNANLNFGTNDFTISFWVNPNDDTGIRSIVFSNVNNSASANLRFWLKEPTGTQNMKLCVGTAFLNPQKLYTPNVWSHYAIVRKDGVFHIYENGILIYSNAALTTAKVDLTDLSIGGNSYVDDTREYKGYIDDFAIYSYAKYTSDFAPPTTEQTDADLLYLGFDGDTIPYNQEPLKDVISDSYLTNVSNADVLGKADEYKFGNASLYFPGTAGQRMTMQNSNLNFGTNDFTVSFWVKPNDDAETRSIVFSNEDNSASANLRFWLKEPSGTPNMKLCVGTTFLDLKKLYTPSVWSHYAIVRKAGVFSVYENGILILTNAALKTAKVDLSDLSIGGNAYITDKREYKGFMDDFAIYSYAKYDGDFMPPTIDAMNDPVNINTDTLDIIDDVSGNDFTVLGANLIGTDIQKNLGMRPYIFRERQVKE